MNRFILSISTCICLGACTTTGTWTNNGPSLGGRLSAIVASPADPNTLIAASPGGGIWRTIDGGAHWVKPLNYSLADFSVLALQWDKIRSGRLYASTYSDVYASTDLGEHWNNLSHTGGYPPKLMPSTEHISDPNPFAQLKYSATASTVFWSKQGYGLYYSYDGTNFTQHFPFPGGASNPENYIQAIAADEATGRVYFATMTFDLQPARLYRSTCAWTATTPCLTWELVNTGFPIQSQVVSIVYGGSANRLAACLRVAASPYTRVYLTTDGTSWSAALNQPPSPSWDPRPMVSPATNQLIVGTVLPYLSNDWGNSWSNISVAGMHPDVRSFYWGSYPNNSYLWATTDGSTSSGTYHNILRWNFTPGNTPGSPVGINTNGMKTWQAYFMAVTAQAGMTRKRIFLGSLDNGLMISDDAGVNWVSAGAVGGCGDYMSLVIAPNNPNRAYIRSCDGTVMGRSDNVLSAATPAAIVWTTLTPAGGHTSPLAWSNAMTAVDPTNADRVCIARSNDITISTNAGGMWEAHSLPNNSKPVCVYIDTDHSIYAGTMDNGIYKSVDNGFSWTAFGLNDGSFKIVSKVIHTSAGGPEGTFFAATPKGLYRKLPGGSFAYVATGGDASYVVSDVEADPSCAARVYVSKGFISGFIQHRGGVLVSSNNGDSFTSITSGLDIHQSPVSDIQVDPIDTRYVYAAVFGSGAWTYIMSTAPGCN